VKCPRCQAENRDSAHFCRECGATFAVACAVCGASLEAGSKFCDSCGAPLVPTPTDDASVLAARIDRLPVDAKRLLQSAAVIGKDVSFALLEAIADAPGDELRRCLVDLQAAEFLYKTRLFPDLEYTFKDSLTHEVTYATLLQERRRAVHARIVEAMERLYKDRLAEKVERLAQHALRGEVWEKAVVYLRQAGAKAHARSANRESVGCFEQALAALKHVPESRSTLEMASDIRFDLRGPLTALGEFGRIRDHLHEAERVAETLADQRRLGRVSGYLGHFFNAMGEYNRAIVLGRRALRIAEAVDDFAVRVVADSCLGDAYFYLGDYRDAISSHTRNKDALHGDVISERFGLVAPPSVLSRTWLALSYAWVGEFANGLACGQEGLEIAEVLKHPYSRIWTHWGLGCVYLFETAFDEATSHLEEGLTLCLETDILTFFPYLASALGAAYAGAGRISEAVQLLESAEAAQNSIKIMAARAGILAFLSEAYLLAHRSDEAVSLAEEALTLSRDHGQRGFEALTMRLLGEIYVDRDPPDIVTAENHYRQATALAGELGTRPLLAHCHYGLGKLYLKTRKRAEAHEQLAISMKMYRAMNMLFSLEQAEAKLNEIRGF